MFKVSYNFFFQAIRSIKHSLCNLYLNQGKLAALFHTPRIVLLSPTLQIRRSIPLLPVGVLSLYQTLTLTLHQSSPVVPTGFPAPNTQNIFIKLRRAIISYRVFSPSFFNQYSRLLIRRNNLSTLRVQKHILSLAKINRVRNLLLS